MKTYFEVVPKPIEEIINLEGLKELAMDYKGLPQIIRIHLADGSVIEGKDIVELFNGHAVKTVEDEAGYRDTYTAFVFKDSWLESKREAGYNLIKIGWHRFLQLIGTDKLFVGYSDGRIEMSNVSRRDSLEDLESRFDSYTYYKKVIRREGNDEKED